MMIVFAFMFSCSAVGLGIGGMIYNMDLTVQMLTFNTLALMCIAGAVILENYAETTNEEGLDQKAGHGMQQDYSQQGGV